MRGGGRGRRWCWSCRAACRRRPGVGARRRMAPAPTCSPGCTRRAARGRATRPDHRWPFGARRGGVGNQRRRRAGQRARVRRLRPGSAGGDRRHLPAGRQQDSYVVSVSDDGVKFRELWASPPRVGRGMRERIADGLGATGAGCACRRAAATACTRSSRCRRSASGRRYSRRGRHGAGVNRGETVRTALLYLVLAFVVLLVATGAGGSGLRVALAACVPIAAGVFVWRRWRTRGRCGARSGVGARRGCRHRAGGADPRGVDCWRRFPAKRRGRGRRVAAAGALARRVFFQPRPAAVLEPRDQRPEFVHLADMRIYQPAVKYFDEVRYDGVYLAAVLAYAEEQHGGSLAPLAQVPVRNLRDQRPARVAELGPDIAAVRARFSDQALGGVQAGHGVLSRRHGTGLSDDAHRSRRERAPAVGADREAVPGLRAGRRRPAWWRRGWSTRRCSC